MVFSCKELQDYKSQEYRNPFIYLRKLYTMKQYIITLSILLCLISLVGSLENRFPLSKGRVVGGAPAISKQFPWQAFIVCCMAIGKSCGTCGGSLVSPRFILTAAHCTDGKTHFDVSLGSIDRFKSLEHMVSQDFIQHQNWDPFTVENDVSLIKLPRPAQLSDFVQVVQLANTNVGALVNQLSIASGFGRTRFDHQASLVLNYMGMKIITNEECKQYFGNSIVSTNICARGLQFSQTLCHGDSGGPLVMKNDDESYTQIGVVSFTYGKCEVGKPTGYARVSSYIGWINKYINEA